MPTNEKEINNYLFDHGGGLRGNSYYSCNNRWNR